MQRLSCLVLVFFVSFLFFCFSHLEVPATVGLYPSYLSFFVPFFRILFLKFNLRIPQLSVDHPWERLHSLGSLVEQRGYEYALIDDR